VSQLRWDPLTQNWVIITRAQGRRPDDFILEREQVVMDSCPFCYGHEERTTAELYAVRPDGSPPNTPGWQVRVIPNKYPALGIEGDLDKRGVGIYDVMNGIGAHEIVVENPDHQRSLAELAPDEIRTILKAYRARLLDLRRDSRFQTVIVFKNYGLEAGAAIPHSHSQIIAVPVLPPRQASELKTCREYFVRKERCLLCDLLQQELDMKAGIVRDDGQFVVFAPYASRYPFELRITPRRHGHDFALQSDQELLQLAETLKNALQRLRSVLRDPPYNLVLQTAPPMHERLGRPALWNSLPYDYHWYLEIIPRLTKTTGFERGTGFTMNPTAPEEAANFLRDADFSAVE
jgi:UDPglucose--hexose-1-phosphate uridylyltransferase